MRSISRGVLAVVLVAAAGLFVGWAIASDDANELGNYLPSPQQAAAENMTVEGPPTAVRTLEEPPGRLRWTLVAYASSDGLCLDWIAEQIGGSERGGMLGRCGPPLDGTLAQAPEVPSCTPLGCVSASPAQRASGDPVLDESPEPLSWSLGGLLVGDQWYNVVHGTGSDHVVKIRITLADGTTRLTEVVNGTWLVTFPGPDPATDNSFDVQQIAAIGTNGDVIASAQPPSDSSTIELYKGGPATH